MWVACKHSLGVLAALLHTDGPCALLTPMRYTTFILVLLCSKKLSPVAPYFSLAHASPGLGAHLCACNEQPLLFLHPHRTFSNEQQAAFFQLASDMLLESQAAGGPLAGVMFWGAAIGSGVWDDGYTIYLDVGLPDLSTPSDSDGDSGAPSDADGPPGPEAPPTVRGPTYVNEEGLDKFR